MVQSKKSGIFNDSASDVVLLEASVAASSSTIKSEMANVLEFTLKFPCNFLLLNKNPSRLLMVPVAEKSLFPVKASKLFRFTIPGFKVKSALLI